MWQQHPAGGPVGLHQGRAGFEPSRPTLLMLHGAGSRGDGFLPQLSGLGDINVLSLDLPGHGQTPGPGREDVADYAGWLAELLAAGPVKPVLMGHSMGGAVAMTLALNHPRLVRGLVLVSTGPRLPVNPALLAGLQADFEASVRLIVKWAYAPEADPVLLIQGTENMLQSDPQVMHGDFVACDGFDFRDRLGGLALPCLILVGEQDKMTPPNLSQSMAEAIPGAELKLIPEAGHMPFLERYQEVNQALSEFMAKF